MDVQYGGAHEIADDAEAFSHRAASAKNQNLDRCALAALRASR
jgi:hypothetical protein